jgi:hypothetical protein
MAWRFGSSKAGKRQYRSLIIGLQLISINNETSGKLKAEIMALKSINLKAAENGEMAKLMAKASRRKYHRQHQYRK